MIRYQDIYPEEPLASSEELPSPRAKDLLTLEFFEAEPGTMPCRVFDQHHILINLKDEPHRVENWRDGEHRDFIYHRNEVVITPAGIESGWEWHAKSRCIVITLLPDSFSRFALNELGVTLTEDQLRSQPQFLDEELTVAAVQLKEAMDSGLGSDVLFESFSGVFLTKLIQKYGEEEQAFTERFSSNHFRRVFDFVAESYQDPISVEEMAEQAFLSPFHFSRLFKKTVGTTPHQFVMDFRIEQSRKMLVRTDVPLGEVAIDCGFSDQAHFSRVFKKATGWTPRQYRLAH